MCHAGRVRYVKCVRSNSWDDRRLAQFALGRRFVVVRSIKLLAHWHMACMHVQGGLDMHDAKAQQQQHGDESRGEVIS